LQGHNRINWGKFIKLYLTSIGSLPNQPEEVVTTEKMKNEKVNSIRLRCGKEIDSAEKKRKLVVNQSPSTV